MLTGDSDPSLGGLAGLAISSEDDMGAPVASRVTAVSRSADMSSDRVVTGARGDEAGDDMYEGKLGEGGPARILPPEFLLAKGGLAIFDPLKERVRKVDGAGNKGGEGAVMCEMARRNGGGTGRVCGFADEVAGALVSPGKTPSASFDRSPAAGLGVATAGGKARGGYLSSELCSVVLDNSAADVLVSGVPVGGVGSVKMKAGASESPLKKRFIIVGIWRGEPGPLGAENAGISCALNGDSILSPDGLPPDRPVPCDLS
jgi:hypothetical protein